MGITIENDQYYMKIAHIHSDGPGQPGLSHLTPLSRMIDNYSKSISNILCRRAFCETMALEYMITPNTPAICWD